MTIITEHIQPLLDSRKISFAFAATLLCWCTGAAAQEHLKPGAETVAGYEESVSHVLKGAFGPGVILNSIVEPSFEPEYAVGVQKKRDGYVVFYVVANDAVWPKLLNKESTDVGATRCEVSISADLANKISGIWDVFLRDLRDDEKYPGVLDGSFYYFSGEIGGKLRIGMSQDARKDSGVGKLQDVGYSMKDLCLKKDEAAETKLDSQVNDLLARLQQPPAQGISK